MHKPFKNLTALAGILILTAGCAATPARDYLSNDNLDASKFDFPTLIAHIRKSSGEARERADEDTRNSEYVGLGLISTGLAAAGGIFFDAHIDYLAGTGVAASGIGGLNQLYDFTGSHDAHSSAATKMICLANISDPLLTGNPIDSIVSRITPPAPGDAAIALAAALADNDPVATEAALAQEAATPLIYEMLTNRSRKTGLLYSAFSDVVMELQKSTRPTLQDIDSIVAAAVEARKKFAEKQKTLNNVGLLGTAPLAAYQENLKSCTTTGKPAAPS